MMSFKKAGSLLILLLALSCKIHGLANWHDTLKISNTEVTADVKSGNVWGIRITLDYTLIYDAAHRQKFPQTLSLQATLLTMEDKPVRAIQQDIHSLKKECVDCIKRISPLKEYSSKKVLLFIPYYMIDLAEGKATLKIKLEASLTDSLYTAGYRAIHCAGQTVTNVTIDKPARQSFNVFCSGTRVANTDKGKSWDFGLNGSPDLIFKVLLCNQVNNDVVFVSTEMQNAFSAAWIDPSKNIIISKGDSITLGIYDNDAMYDDLIGSKSFTLEEWMEISKAATELNFDQVNYFTVKVKQVE